jgi:glycosyltransferase involved in cell wall biosynthesis
METHVRVVIPTYQRALYAPRAVEAALAQSYPHRTVMVVDDGSTDDTRRALERFFGRPDFCYVRLAANAGTAPAKNVGLCLGAFDAVTFHDSDDLPDPHKLLRQVRALRKPVRPSEMFDWEGLGRDPDEPLEVDVVVGAHEFVRLDGTSRVIRDRASLFDDFFPHVQQPRLCEGDWILVNSGLFRRRVFAELGGYLDSVEEDRELRNRLLATGKVFHFVEEPLLTKIEMASSLTVDRDTGYRGEVRRRARREVWERLRRVRAGLWGRHAVDALRAPVDLAGIELAEVTRPELARPASDLPMTEATARALHQDVGGLRASA